MKDEISLGKDALCIMQYEITKIFILQLLCFIIFFILHPSSFHYSLAQTSMVKLSHFRAFAHRQRIF